MEFEVKVVELSEVVKHPDADLLEIAHIQGYDYQCVVRKGQHQAGEVMVYIPTGAIVPEALLQELGLWDEAAGKGRLSGSAGNRLTAVRLRGAVSQGLLAPPPPAARIGDEVGEQMGIVKYEPPIPAAMQGQALSAINLTPDYDLSDIKKWPHILQDGEFVYYTEKLHGTLSCFGYIPGHRDDRLVNGSALIASKSMLARASFMEAEENRRNLYVQTFKSQWLDSGQWAELTAFADRENQPVYVFGEIFGRGVQHLAYGYERTKGYRVFDLYLGHPDQGRFLTYPECCEWLRPLDIQPVPLLYEGPHSQETLLQYREGQDILSGSHVREGLVVSPAEERRDRELGRVKLKAVSDGYLFGKGQKTEFN